MTTPAASPLGETDYRDPPGTQPDTHPRDRVLGSPSGSSLGEEDYQPPGWGPLGGNPHRDQGTR